LAAWLVGFFVTGELDDIVPDDGSRETMLETARAMIDDYALASLKARPDLYYEYPDGTWGLREKLQ